MKKLLKWLLSPSVNLSIGIVIGYLLYTNYKFFITYCLMAPIAKLFSWFFIERNSEKYNRIKNSTPKNVWIISVIFASIWNSVFWIGYLISSTRIAFFPEEDKINV